MFFQLGRFAYRYRWQVIAAWLLFFFASVPILPRVSGVLAVGGFSSRGTETANAQQVLETKIPSYSPSDLVIIFHDPTVNANSEQFVVQSQQALKDVLTLPHVEGETTFQQNPRQISADGHTAYNLVHLDIPSEQAQRLVSNVRQSIHPTQLEVRVAGGPAFYADIETVTERDLRRAEVIAIPFALLALVLVFGSLVTAGVPIVVGGVSVACVLGAIFLTAHVVDLSIFVLNLATLLGLGLAIDYSLFMTSRFQEELTHQNVADAVASTVATAGKAVFFSGLTVLIGLSGLSIFNIMFLRSVGVAGALVVFFAVLGALTLLPAVLGVIGVRVDRLSIYRRRDNTGSFWHWVAERVMAHPWFVLIPVVTFLLILGLPFSRVNLSSPDATILPLSTGSRQGFELLRTQFGDGSISPIVVAVESNGPINSPQNIANLYNMTRKIAQDQRVWEIDSIVTLDPRIALQQYQLMYSDPTTLTDPYIGAAYHQLAGSNATVLYVYTQALPSSNEAKSLLAMLRNMNPGPGLTMQVGGGTGEIVDVVHSMYTDFPIAIAMIVLATYVTLFLQFRSLILPIKAVLMNAMSIVASYGALVWIFQEGHLSGLLNFEPLGFVEASLPVVMFSLLFGLSMDYEVFLLSRVREVWDETGDNRLAVSTGLARSGRIITGAALILVVVASSFATADVVLIKALGVGIAIAVTIDATIVRALLVPATMRLLGHLNWWAPDWAKRLTRRTSAPR